VYRALDGRFHRSVAIKVIVGALDEPARQRFGRECRAMGVVSRHPHCVTVYDSGFDDDGRAYLVMEDMAGGALGERVLLDWAEVLDIGVKVAGALHAAHTSGVLHRDIKPENVLMSAYDEPKLGDFGIARLDDGLRSRTGTLSATPAYAAPELFAGQPATPGSDVYALASTLYALIDGRAPFLRDTDESYLPLVARIVNETVPDLRHRGIPVPVCAALEAGLEKDPTHRVASALDYGSTLQDAQRAVGGDVTRMVGRNVPAARGRDLRGTVVVPAPGPLASSGQPVAAPLGPHPVRTPPPVATPPPAGPGVFALPITASPGPVPTPGVGYWFYVDDPEWLVSPYDSGQVAGVLQPGQWYLAGEEAGGWVYAADERGAEGWVPGTSVRRYRG